MSGLTLRHAVLHLAKYLGEVANIAEKADHGEDIVELAREHLEKRFRNDRHHWLLCLEAVEEHLRGIVEVDDPTFWASLE